jgi:hypothetical protein
LANRKGFGFTAAQTEFRSTVGQDAQIALAVAVVPSFCSGTSSRLPVMHTGRGATQKEDARYCFGQMLVLSPHSAPFLLCVADFHFQIGENQEALPITARILALIPDYDSVIFSEYIHFIWLLNNDTIVEPQSLTALIEVIASDPRIAAVGSVIYHMEDPGRVQVWGGWRVRMRLGIVSRYERQMPIERLNFISGAGCLLRTEAIRSVGLFDEGFFNVLGRCRPWIPAT